MAQELIGVYLGVEATENCRTAISSLCCRSRWVGDESGAGHVISGRRDGMGRNKRARAEGWAAGPDNPLGQSPPAASDAGIRFGSDFFFNTAINVFLLLSFSLKKKKISFRNETVHH